MKRALRVITLISAILVLCSVGSVYAFWEYGSGDRQNSEVDLPLSLIMPPPTPWEDKEILPAEHTRLVEVFAHQIDDPNSPTNALLLDRVNGALGLGIIRVTETGSMDDKGDELREIFNCQNSSFMIDLDYTMSGSFWSGYTYTFTGYTIYTTETDLTGLAPGDYVENIYQTTFKKDETGNWAADQSTLGYAEFAYYKNEWGQADQSKPAWNISSWKAGTPPTA